MHVDCNRFGHQIFLFLWCEHLMRYCSIVEKEGKIITVGRGGVYWVLPITHNDW